MSEVDGCRPRPSVLVNGRGRHIHFVGIGGIGVSSIASILLARGFSVSGSDIKANRLTQEISRRGGEIFIGHRASNLSDKTGLVVYSTSVNEGNPELIAAKKRGIPVLHRSDVAAQLLNPGVGIAITGAHGKTTTTALSALLLIKAGLDPTVIIGGEADFLNGNWRDGKGDIVVCEADESDGTFTKLRPRYALLTNIDREHLEYYEDFEDLLAANRSFIENIKDGGCLITAHDDPNVKKVLGDCAKSGRIISGKLKVITYSALDGGADIHTKGIREAFSQSHFEVMYKGRPLGLFELNIPGRHNVENSLAVILLGLELGIGIEVVREALSQYKGALRRFELKADVGDIMIIEDYAHHPREITATILACRNWTGRRLIGVFQPHRYTRTKFLKEEFGRSFLGLDELILTDIYGASEKPIDGVTARLIYDEALRNGQKNIHLLKKDQILRRLLKILRPRDIVLVLGAGDIGELSDGIVKGLILLRKSNRITGIASQKYSPSE